MNTGAPCAEDGDCDHLDCRGRCHREERRCAGARWRTEAANVATLCRKIFLGRYPYLVRQAFAGFLKTHIIP